MSKKNFTQLIFLLLTLAALWLGAGWSAAGAHPGFIQAASATVTPAPSATPTPLFTATRTSGPTPTLTPLPAQYLETPDQTTGILFGAVFLLVIIFGGTLFILRSQR